MNKIKANVDRLHELKRREQQITEEENKNEEKRQNYFASLLAGS